MRMRVFAQYAISAFTYREIVQRAGIPGKVWHDTRNPIPWLRVAGDPDHDPSPTDEYPQRLPVFSDPVLVRVTAHLTFGRRRNPANLASAYQWTS